jgi:hypothetical protein
MLLSWAWVTSVKVLNKLQSNKKTLLGYNIPGYNAQMFAIFQSQNHVNLINHLGYNLLYKCVVAKLLKLGIWPKAGNFWKEWGGGGERLR